MPNDVTVNSKGLQKFDAMLTAATESIGAPTNPHRIMFRRWSARYASFTRRRFIRMSRGGSDTHGRWPDLARSTKLARRQGRKKRKRTRGKKTDLSHRVFAILVDTGSLRDAIQPGVAGNLLADVPGGIDIGFAATPIKGTKKLTMGQLASYHHYGRGHNKIRPILVDIDDGTRRLMFNDARAAGVMIEKILGP